MAVEALAGPIINALLSLGTGALIRYYPLKGKLRISVRRLVLIYFVVFLIQATVYVLMREYFAHSYSSNQLYKLLSGLIPMLIPFFLTRDSFFQQLFLLAVVAHNIVVIFGLGVFTELQWGGEFAQRYPYIISDGVVLLLSALLLPPALIALRRLLAIWPDSRSPFWRFVWIIPTLFVLLCLLAANILMGDSVATRVFYVARIFISVGMVVTCFLLAKLLRQESDTAQLTEHTRMMNIQLAIQREQFAKLAESSEQEKAARHDMRHHLAALQGYSAKGNIEALNQHLEALIGSLPLPHRKWCENHGVNAVAGHYLSIAQSEGVSIDVALDIPLKAGRIPDIDLCVVVGNLLENAVEACENVEENELSHRFIRVRSNRQGDFLSILVENSFDGTWQEKDGVYYSRKASAEGERFVREGVGLNSVQAICDKYDGLMRIEAGARVWCGSVVLVG